MPLAMGSSETTVRVLDAAYHPFPQFHEWALQTSVDTARWNRYNSSLQNRSGVSADVLKRARDVAKRAAALDTGAIEGFYEVDRGFTYTVAFETSAWEATLAQRGEHVRPMFEAQLHAYDYVLDLSTKAEPISEAAIRALHVEISRAQETYRVATPVGFQDQPLPKGQYKALPNHVRTRVGTDHSYAPVDMTPPEMQRLVGELRTTEFLSAHPVLQAAYAHYGFVAIHPFADGNGRVARALASAFTYRAIAMPIMILSEHKNNYFDALAASDAGSYQPFVDFMMSRSLDTIELVDQGVRSALAPAPELSLGAIDALYLTKGGYTHEQVDDAGNRLVNALKGELDRAVSANASPNVSAQVMVQPVAYQVTDAAFRRPLSNPVRVLVALLTRPPAQAQVARDYNPWLPRDPAGSDDILLKNTASPDAFAARMDELIPAVSGVLQIRLSLFAERLIRELLSELSAAATKALGVARR